MSDASPDPSSTPEPPAPRPEPAAPRAGAAADETKPAPAKPKGRWRRRAAIGLIVLFVLAVALRLSIRFTLPPVLRKAAAAYGLNATYDRLGLTLLGGDANIWGLTLTPLAGGDPVVRIDYVRADIAPLALLAGKLVVWRAEADGVDVLMYRDAAGHSPLLDVIAKATATDPDAPPPATSEPMDLSAPLTLEALRLNRVRARILDESVTPPVDTTIAADVRVSDLSEGAEPATFEIDLWADPVLDVLRVTGESTLTEGRLDADMVVEARGLRLKPVAGYLEPLGLRPVANEIAGRLKAKLTATPAAGDPTAMAVTVDVTDLTAGADGEEAVGVDAIAIAADAVGPASAKVASVTVDGVRLFARRTDAGVVRAAGIEVVPAATPTTTRPDPQEPAGPPAGPVPATQPTAPFAWSLGELAIRNVRGSFRDEAVAPTADLALIVDDLSITNLSSDAGSPDAAAADVAIKLRVPGLAEAVDVTGTAKPGATTQAVDLTVAATGVSLDALEPYLDGVGAESLIRDGTFGMKLSADATTADDGTITANARVTDLALRAPDELLTLSGIHVTGLTLDPAGARIAVKEIAVTGPTLSAKREASGAFTAVGVRVDPAKLAAPSDAAAQAADPAGAAAPTTAPTTAPVVAASKPALPAIEIGRFAWTGVRVRLDDETVQPPSGVAIEDAGVELANVTLDLATTTAGAPGTLRAWLVAPGLAQRLGVEGTITPEPSAVAVDLDLTGAGLSGAAIASYLKPLDVEPLLTDGKLAGKIRARVAQVTGDAAGGLDASLAVERFRFTDGDTELAGVDGLRVDGLSLRPEALTVEAIEIDRPRATVRQERGGALVAGGVRLLPTTQPAPEPVELPPVVLKRLALRGAEVTWIDEAVAGDAPATVAATVNAALDGFAIADNAGPAPFLLDVAVRDALERLNVAGTVQVRPAAQEARFDVTATGLRAGPLAAYLPPGMTVDLVDGRFKASVEAAVGTHADGGQTARLAVTRLDFRDGEAGPPLASLEALRVDAPRIDPEGGVIAVKEVTLQGLEADATLTADGATKLLGVTMAPAGEAQAAAEAADPATASAPQGAAPTTGPAQDVAALVAEARKPPPLVTLETLDLNVRRFGVRDASRPEAAPLALTDVRLRNTAPIEVGGEDAESRPPVKLALTGAIDPVVGHFAVVAEAAPLAREPSLTVDASAEGIRGDGLTELLPELKAQIDGSALTDGRFRARLESVAQVQRRGGTIALTDGFEADLLLKGIEYRAAADGPVLAGVEEVSVEGAEVDPKTGGLRVKTLQVTKPVAAAYRDVDGIHLLGLLVKLPEEGPATQPSLADDVAQAGEDEPAETADAAAEQSNAAAPATRPSAEVRVDKLVVSGLDVRVEDRSVDPPFVLPLNGLDVEVRDLSNLAPFENRPIRFSAMVSANKVTLPKKLTGGAIAGALGDLAAVMKKDEVTTAPATEERELFSQIVASGRMSLYPRPTGWVKTSVNGFELSSLAGLAKEAGVDVGGGVFDTSVDARFRPDGSLDARTRFTFTDLKVSEPPGGPIFRYLHLPAPLDAVILALQDAGGSINIPLGVKVKDGEVSPAQVAGAASGALLQVIGVALASAPLKAVTGVGGMLGLGGDDKPVEAEPVAIDFAPGDTALDRRDRAALAALVERMRKDKRLTLVLRHELAAADVAIAAARSNPPPADAAALAGRLRARKLELAELRADLAGAARAELASRSAGGAAATLERLRAVSRELAETEDALDSVYELLRPGADRQASRRTRTAGLALAQERLDAVHRTLLDAVARLPNGTERVRPASAQFNPTDGAENGRVVITLVGASK